MLAHPPVSWVSLLLDPQPRSLFLALCFPLLQVCSNIWSKVVGETKCMRAATKRIRFHFRAREINTRKRDSFSSITHWGIPKNRKGIECHRIHTKKVVPFSFPLQLVKKTKRKCHDIKKEKPRWNESRHARCGTKRIESPLHLISYWCAPNPTDAPLVFLFFSSELMEERKKEETIQLKKETIGLYCLRFSL